MNKLENHTLSQKLQKQSVKNPILFFADVDGTLFTAGWQIMKAPLYNFQTSQILEKNNIPNILVTGRPRWNQFSNYEMFLHGIPDIDAVIFAAGTSILHKKTDGAYEKDLEWEKHVSRKTWDGKKIFQRVTTYCAENKFYFKIKQNNRYLIRITAINIPVKQLQKIISDFQKISLDDIRIITTEKLLKPNSLDIFSGDIIITPKNIGKDTAIQYLLKKYALIPSRGGDEGVGFHALIFGDASIDIPMLTMPDNPKQYSLSQYGVHLTPLAKKTLQEKQKTNKNLYVINDEGPQAIVKVMKNLPAPNIQSATLSPAQNSKLRLLVKPFEKILDSILDKNLSPNDISFLGLRKVTEGISLTQKKNILEKIKGLWLYTCGILIDGLDGIRARQSITSLRGKKRRSNPDELHRTAPNGITSPVRQLVRNDVNSTPGQLVDVFCDRAKEFYQLYKKVETQDLASLQITKFSEQTLLTAISCILPSLARAQAESHGIIVPEKDDKGGSMFDRTKLLSLSLLYDTFGFHKKSLQIDKKIYENNMATFENRLYLLRHCEPVGTGEAIPLTKGVSPNNLQQKSLERFLLLVELLQEENKIIEKSLLFSPEILRQYRKEIEPLIKKYLTININELRKKRGVEDYNLKLEKYVK